MTLERSGIRVSVEDGKLWIEQPHSNQGIDMDRDTARWLQAVALPTLLTSPQNDDGPPRRRAAVGAE